MQPVSTVYSIRHCINGNDRDDGYELWNAEYILARFIKRQINAGRLPVPFYPRERFHWSAQLTFSFLVLFVNLVYSTPDE